MKVGILVPRSKAYPSISLDFLDGFRSYLKNISILEEIEILTESIGFGASEKEVYEKGEKLLMLEGSDLIIAYVDLRVLQILNPLIMATGKIVIAVNPGANRPPLQLPQPTVIHLTLQHSFLCYLSGRDAGNDEEKKALLASTFYDCGYGHSSTIVDGLTANKGEITFNYFNKSLYNENFEIVDLLKFLSENSTHNLLCVFDALPASLLYNQLNTYEHADRLQLFVSPMMLEEPALKNNDTLKFQIQGYKPWDPHNNTDANQKFIDIYNSNTKRPANIFSLLGWETAIVLKEIISLQEDDRNEELIVEMLKQKTIKGPRGEMKLDPVINYFTSPFVKSYTKKGSAELHTEHINFPEDEWQIFRNINVEGITSGWLNTYLCY